MSLPLVVCLILLPNGSSGLQSKKYVFSLEKSVDSDEGGG